MQKRGDCFRCLMLESHRCGNRWIGDKPCPDGMQFEEYTGSKVKQCIGATMEIFQDGYMHCPILYTEGMGCEWCMEKVREDKSFFQPDPSQNYERVPRWKKYNKEEIMTTYFTKCGRTFEKSTKAVVTGYEVPDEWASMDNVRKAGRIKDDECRKCPWTVEVTDGYPPVFKRYECRAGSLPPNYETTWRGSLDDKNTLNIYSLDFALMAEIVAFAQIHPDLSAAYNADSQADCRRTISVSCSSNKKGMSAKQELIDKFFPVQGATPDPADEQEIEEICGNCLLYQPKGPDIGKCGDNFESVSRVRPACETFMLDSDDDLDEEEISSMDLEDQLDVLLEAGDKADKAAGKATERSCGSCSCGHWFSAENTYVNVVQDDGVKTVKRPCKPHTHYCYQFAEGQREIAGDKDFDPESAPGWCPLGEIVPPAPVPAPKKQPRTGSQGCQEMREDCPCFCAHNDGCAVLLATGGALKAYVDQFTKDGSVDCEVFRKGAERVSGTHESVNEQLESVNDSVPDVIKPAEVGQAPAFDYSELDSETVSALRMIEGEITRIKMQTVYDIGSYLKIANDALAKTGHGTFGAWCESIGFSRASALNYIQAYEFIRINFSKPEDAIGIQPSLLFAASKPSAPPELAQAVIDGDITKHKDYIKAMEELKEAKKTAEDWHNAYENQRSAKNDVVKELEESEHLRKVEAESHHEQSKNVQDLVNQQIDDQRKIFNLEQQIGQLQANSSPEKLEQLGEVIKEKREKIKNLEDEVALLRQELNAKPIEVPAVEVREIVPESLEIAWAANLQMAIYQIAELSDDELIRLVMRLGLNNYAVLKDSVRMNCHRAKSRLEKLADVIFSAPAPADTFIKWAKEDPTDEHE